MSGSGGRRSPSGRVEFWAWSGAAVVVLVPGVVGAATGFPGALPGTVVVAAVCVGRALLARRRVR